MNAPAPEGRLPRVLLVEDDASIRRFVSMVLEEEPLQLLQAGTLLQAIELLRDIERGRSRPLDLVLCDLMLPDGSGLDLLRALSEPDSPCPDARRVAFSAGVSAETRQRLQDLGVREVLAKPTSVSALLDCVRRATGAAPASPVETVLAGAAGAEDAIARAFGGDRSLYQSFAEACRLQWPQDVAQGDRALAAGDRAALRRLAHSLKSVLQTLGHDEAAAQARRLEEACVAQPLARLRADTAGDPPEGPPADTAQALWQGLRARLLDWAAPTSPPAPT